MKKLFLILGCIVLLSGCASAPSQDDGSNVQELTPGQQSVIQPPAQAQPAKGSLEERNI